MGNVVSTSPDSGRNANNMSESENTMASSSSQGKESNEELFYDIEEIEDVDRIQAQEEEMNEFKRQLSIKREQRKEILARHRAKKLELEKSLEDERKSRLELMKHNKILRDLLVKNQIEVPDVIEQGIEDTITETIVRMREEFEVLKTNNNTLRKDLSESNRALQSAYSEMADLSAQNTESIKQINALKQVISVSKTMINLREEQLVELKKKLNEIEQSLVDREANLLSNDLRQEYERQLQNIRTLRGLYEERARLAEVTRLGLVRDLEEQRQLLENETVKCRNLSEKVDNLEDEIKTLQTTVDNKNDQISTSLDESRTLKEEMSVINKLFSQVLLGYQTNQDLDKLVHRLEENHGLLTHMAERENDAEASSALPKLLLELVNQVDEIEENSSLEEKEGAPIETLQTSTAEEIVENLPKVWRVLMELLSHQSQAEVNPPEKVTTCYKSVETKSGPVLVPSVSQTYIRLKDLIVEKLGLVKEVNRMKQLNSHLETRLEEQERRLCLVSTELSKTWHVVGRLRRHHHQLHTHEKILKYELQQKRKLLNELKEELAYCREKWEQAREKNTQSERDWRKLRAEFSSRKPKLGSPSLNNSAESGYSDERPSDESSESNDESEYVPQPLVKCKKKFKKSFETILDSSSDFNLAAEREDPASEMLDVADLPLDTQESDETHDVSLQNSEKTESLHQKDLHCDETEDEICEIPNDHVHDISYQKEDCKSVNQAIGSSTKDEKNVEKDNQSRCLHSEASVNSSDIDIASTSGSKQTEDEAFILKDKYLETIRITSPDHTLVAVNLSEQSNGNADNIFTPKASSSSTTHETIPSAINDDGSNKSALPQIDFKAILENVRKQNEMVARKEERLKNLETNCNDVLTKMCNTLTAGENMLEKLGNLQKGQELSPDNVQDGLIEGDDKKDTEEVDDRTTLRKINNDEREPSTSAENDHEARFAARDLRLKRLEEQTKCLVNKVNNTNSKGIKIHYKLEELHNIYGSEGSRAGTPFDEADEKSTKEGEDSTEEQ